MRRYIFNKDLARIDRTSADVLIIGSGAAGLYAALSLDPAKKVLVLNKSDIKHSNSMYAQGGIAAVIEPNPLYDDPKQHYEDTLTAGAGLCDKKAVKVLVEEAWENIEKLIELGVPFDRKDGDILLTREGGHGKNRILHSGGDATGLHLTESLAEAVKKHENIQIWDGVFLTDILTNDAGVTGVVVLDNENVAHHIVSPYIIIASGGIGRVYRNSTNAVTATGDGIAAARRAGAKLKDMEFVQFHPTAFIHPDDEGRYFLISEALRGEGAILRNRKGEAFMQGVHPLADLAPRDIVSRAIISEMKRSDIPNVYLDITSKSRSFLKNRFPTIYTECMRRGVDIAHDWIPVMPVQHYFMGGIRTDVDGRTNIEGLYACGEAACTGVHGANRLASNSLLECIVFGGRAAKHIQACGQRVVGEPDYEPVIYKNAAWVDFDSYSSEIRMTTTYICGIIRNGKDLAEASAWMKKMFRQMDGLELDSVISAEAYNRALVALEIMKGAISRKKSVGAHCRVDDVPEGGIKTC